MLTQSMRISISASKTFAKFIVFWLSFLDQPIRIFNDFLIYILGSSFWHNFKACFGKLLYKNFIDKSQYIFGSGFQFDSRVNFSDSLFKELVIFAIVENLIGVVVISEGLSVFFNILLGISFIYFLRSSGSSKLFLSFFDKFLSIVKINLIVDQIVRCFLCGFIFHCGIGWIVKILCKSSKAIFINHVSIWQKSFISRVFCFDLLFFLLKFKIVEWGIVGCWYLLWEFFGDGLLFKYLLRRSHERFQN